MCRTCEVHPCGQVHPLGSGPCEGLWVSSRAHAGERHGEIRGTGGTGGDMLSAVMDTRQVHQEHHNLQLRVGLGPCESGLTVFRLVIL